MANLTEKDVAARFRVSTRTIQLWRAEGDGPAFLQVGKRTVLYREEDVAEYEAKRARGGYIAPQAKHSMTRAAAMFEQIANWSTISEAARRTVLDMQDELRAHFNQKQES